MFQEKLAEIGISVYSVQILGYTYKFICSMHVCCCHTCGTKVADDTNTCPICRQRIDQVVRQVCFVTSDESEAIETTT